MKKKVILKYVLCTLSFISVMILLFLAIIRNERLVHFLSHGIFLPKPVEVQYIYYYDFREGQDLEVWIYQEKEFNKLISKRKFKKIENDRDSIIKKKFEEYYNLLDKDERKKFNENVKLKTIMDAENFYYYKQDKDEESTFVIMIADVKEMKLYIFNSVT